MGNNTTSEVKGIGKLKIVNPSQSTVILTDVRYMPTMGINMISYGQLEKHGCNYEGSGYKVTFFKQGKKVLSRYCNDGLYYLQGFFASAEASVARAEVNMTNIWHSRLGHMSLKNMILLDRMGYLDNKEVHTLSLCEECVLGKTYRQPFSTAKYNLKYVLDYIHSDLWGSPSNE